MLLIFGEYHLDSPITALQAVSNEKRLVQAQHSLLLCPSSPPNPGSGSATSYR